ncbi:unnamed protein product [Rotaria sp. Silwood2]|nr:unnamed protein product [Rotaria sp. Silwood2]
MNSTSIFINNCTAEAETNQEIINKRRRCRHQRRKRLSNDVTPFTKQSLKHLNRTTTKRLSYNDAVDLEEKLSLCSMKNLVLDEEIVPVTSSQEEVNLENSLNLNIEHFQDEESSVEFIDDFNIDQESLSSTSDDDLESINNTDDHAETLQTGQIDCELHSLTHVTVEKAMVNLLQLIRQSQISKKQSERLLYFIKSILPVPNQMPKDMDTLLKALNMTDYFNKRTICILCDKDLEKNKNLCIFKVDVVQQIFNIKIYGCIGDSPALKLMANMVGHNGYYPCYFCYIKGVHIRKPRKRQYYYSSTNVHRTVNSFYNDSRKAQLNNQKVFGHLGISILEEVVDIPLPHSIIIDYAHVSLLRHFRDVVRVVASSLAPAVREKIDASLRKQRFPHFFNRKMRGIQDFSFIKAAELKNLLLYGFIPHFMPYLTSDQLCFIALFTIGIRLLHSDDVFSPNTSVTANNLLCLLDLFVLERKDPLYYELLNYHNNNCDCNDFYQCIKTYRRSIIFNKMFHSLQYTKRKNTNSYFVQYLCGLSHFNYDQPPSNRLNLPSISTSLPHESYKTQVDTPGFTAYRARRSRVNDDTLRKRKQSKNVLQQQQTNIKRLPQYDEEEEIESNQNIQYDSDEDDPFDENLMQHQNRTNVHRYATKNKSSFDDVVDDDPDPNTEGNERKPITQ